MAETAISEKFRAANQVSTSGTCHIGALKESFVERTSRSSRESLLVRKGVLAALVVARFHLSKFWDIFATNIREITLIKKLDQNTWKETCEKIDVRGSGAFEESPRRHLGTLRSCTDQQSSPSDLGALQQQPLAMHPCSFAFFSGKQSNLSGVSNSSH